MKRALLVGALLAILLSACGGPAQGYVSFKRIEPPQDWLQPVPIYTTTCSGQVCTTTLLMFVNVPQHIDECPKLWLKPDPGKDGSKTVCVSRDTYDRVSIGDFYKEPPT